GRNARSMLSTPKQRDLFDRMVASGEISFPKGRMYEVNINADPEALLDWDKPLSEQSQHVQNILKQFGLYGPRKTATGAIYDPAGSVAYDALASRGNDVAASSALREAGIPGIKYLDQASRAAGEGTRNYVMFDDALIDIMRKYGLVPPIVLGGAAGGQAVRGLFDEER